MRALLLLGMGWSAVLIAAGCNRVNPPIYGRQDPYPAGQFHVASRYLNGQVAAGAGNLTRDAAGILHVNVPVRADVSEKVYIDYRLTFLDRNGQVVSRTGWMPKVLEGNIPDVITGNSLNARAADYQLDIRKAE